MKLRSCHIDNFGKLSDLHLEFQDGVNLFHEPNAWGKSTLMIFERHANLKYKYGNRHFWVY